MVMSSQRDNDFGDGDFSDGDFGAEFPAFLAFGRGRFYQRFERKAITAMPLQRGVFEGINTPARGLFRGGQTARQRHSATCAMTSPNSSSTADRTGRKMVRFAPAVTAD
jgi:hypothetical protein